MQEFIWWFNADRHIAESSICRLNAFVSICQRRFSKVALKSTSRDSGSCGSCWRLPIILSPCRNGCNRNLNQRSKCSYKKALYKRRHKNRWPSHAERTKAKAVPSFIVNLPVIKQPYVLLNQHRFESHLLHYIQFLCSSTAHLYTLPWLR